MCVLGRDIARLKVNDVRYALACRQDYQRSTSSGQFPIKLSVPNLDDKLKRIGH